MYLKLKSVPLASVIAISLFAASCQKNEISTDTADLSSGTIAVAASATAAAATDSVFLLQSCGRAGHRDSIGFASLPVPATDYIAANYAGAINSKAFSVTSNGAISGYVAVIYFNDKPVGLLFDATGTFLKVLEQRERGDLSGPGHHRGGRFEHRDGLGRDTIALSALPASVTAYLAANYPGDTLVKAVAAQDGSILVVSKNNGAFVTVFTADGTFVEHEALPARDGSCAVIDISALPSVSANYLTQTYPNYVFEKAFSITRGGVLAGYVVLIDANNTSYAVTFDAAGAFVRAKTIH
jgi:Ca2+-binding RTX toxin-like protein